MWRERRSSPGCGLQRSPSQPALPISGMERPCDYVPVTVAGPHRHHTGFRVPRSQSIVAGILSRAVLVGKRGGETRLECGTLGLITRARLGAWRRVGCGKPLEARVENGDLV